MLANHLSLGKLKNLPVPLSLPMVRSTSYEEAIMMVKRLKPLVTGLDSPAGINQYIVLLRAKYKAKRNYIKMQDNL